MPVPADSRGASLDLDLADAVQHELGEEGIEVGEVPVQDASGTACLGGDRPAGQARSARPGAGRDGGSFTMHYTTVAVTSARTSAPDPA